MEDLWEKLPLTLWEEVICSCGVNGISVPGHGSLPLPWCSTALPLGHSHAAMGQRLSHHCHEVLAYISININIYIYKRTILQVMFFISQDGCYDCSHFMDQETKTFKD